MTREAFIRKWLGNRDYPYNEQNRDLMRDDLDELINKKMKTKEEIKGILRDYWEETNFCELQKDVQDKYTDIFYNLQEKVIKCPETLVISNKVICELKEEIERLQGIIDEPHTKPEPSRTEIAAIIAANIAGRTDFLVTTNEANIATVAIRLTDELIKQLNET